MLQISQTYGTSMTSIMKLNSLGPKSIIVEGQVLMVPEKPAAVAAPKPTASRPLLGGIPVKAVIAAPPARIGEQRCARRM